MKLLVRFWVDHKEIPGRVISVDIPRLSFLQWTVSPPCMPEGLCVITGVILLWGLGKSYNPQLSQADH